MFTAVQDAPKLKSSHFVYVLRSPVAPPKKKPNNQERSNKGPGTGPNSIPAVPASGSSPSSGNVQQPAPDPTLDGEPLGPGDVERDPKRQKKQWVE